MRRRCSAILAAVLAIAGAGHLSPPAQADDAVDLLLVLAADISRSVDERKFRLQREGYAAAIAEARVIRAMTGGPTGRIALCFVEWSGENDQTTVVDWTFVAGENDAQTVAKRIHEAPRAFMGRTSISAAINYGMAQFARSPFQSDQRIIDVSGDGTNNAGQPVTLVRDVALAQGITINGLVILSDVPLPTNPMHTHPPGGLAAYYESNVVGGPGAFVVEAQNFESFGQSLISKLIKEIAAVTRRRG
jgi:hypothetical protein